MDCTVNKHTESHCAAYVTKWYPGNNINPRIGYGDDYHIAILLASDSKSELPAYFDKGTSPGSLFPTVQ